MVEVVLVDNNDDEIGRMEKMEAHKKGLLHRAFSVFLFDDSGNLLIHRRAENKYHSGGLWTNTCCSHPLPNEGIIRAGQRRLREELGISSELKRIGHVVYNFDLGNGLSEHEYDHVLIGDYIEQDFELNSDEVSEIRFISREELQSSLESSPDSYTEWFKHILLNIDIWQ